MRRAALAVAAGVLAVGALGSGSASAAGARDAGTMQEAGKGVPASMRHGQTVYLTMYVRQHSNDILVPQSFGLSLWNMKAPAGMLRGISATWWNPVTHRWEKASHYDSLSGYIGFYLPDSPQMRISSGTLAHVYVRITFSRAAFVGLWHFMPELGSYYLLTAKGQDDYAYLDLTSERQYTSTLR
jgi:hypothetical protein